jgi:hypothetical protein
MTKTEEDVDLVQEGIEELSCRIKVQPYMMAVCSSTTSAAQSHYYAAHQDTLSC